MTLTRCKTCGGKVSKNATSCPHCGEPEFISPYAQEPPAVRDAGSCDEDSKPAHFMNRKLKRWHLAAFIVAAILVISYSFINYLGDLSDKNPTAKNPSGSDLNLYAELAAEGIVKGKLKAPATASFSDTKVIAKSNDQFLVQTTVDAQNSFGATLRSTYLVVLRIDPADASKAFHNSQFAVQEVSQPPTPEEIQTTKYLNGWK